MSIMFDDDEFESSKKQRKSCAGRKLMRWNPAEDQHVLLAIDYVCTKQGVPIPWNDIAKIVEDHLTGEAIKQHLVKLRVAREQVGLKVPEKLDRTARRKPKGSVPVTPQRGRKVKNEEGDAETEEMPASKVSGLIWIPEKKTKNTPRKAATMTLMSKTPRKGKKVMQDEDDAEANPDGDFDAPKSGSKRRYKKTEIVTIKQEPSLSDGDESSYGSPTKKMKTGVRRAARVAATKVKEPQMESDDEDMLADPKNYDKAEDYDEDGEYKQQTSPKKQEQLDEKLVKLQMPDANGQDNPFNNSNAQDQYDDMAGTRYGMQFYQSTSPYHNAPQAGMMYGMHGMPANASYGNNHTLNPTKQDSESPMSTDSYGQTDAMDQLSSNDQSGDIPIGLSPSLTAAMYHNSTAPYNISDNYDFTNGIGMSMSNEMFSGNYTTDMGPPHFGMDSSRSHTGLTPAISRIGINSYLPNDGGELTQTSTHDSFNSMIAATPAASSMPNSHHTSFSSASSFPDQRQQMLVGDSNPMIGGDDSYPFFQNMQGGDAQHTGDAYFGHRQDDVY